MNFSWLQTMLYLMRELPGLSTMTSDQKDELIRHARRGWEAIEAQGILPKRIAVLVHDCWKPYWQLDCVHAQCNAHLLRELTFLLETTGQAWNKRMIDLLLDANKACEAARQQNEKALAQGRVKQILADYQAILRSGSGQSGDQREDVSSISASC